MTPFLILRDLAKGFGGQPVLERISLEVEEGEVLVLLGPSGSGKTTLLRLIAGFEVPDRGEIRVGGRDVTRVSPERRNFGMVFQHYALFPHLTVARNLAFGLEARKIERREIERRTAELLPLVDLEGFEERKVHQISGGQQQRVALARALAPEPQVLLLDEPLSNLDPALRERTRRQLKKIIRRVGITAVWVTHEQEEAFAVGDRVALLNRGHLEQVGPPEELYMEPATAFAASFVGRASRLRGELTGEGRVAISSQGGASVEWSGSSAEKIDLGSEVLMVFRPESLRLVEAGTPGAMEGEVSERRFLGEGTYYLVDLGRSGTLLVAGPPAAAELGQRVGVAPRREGAPARIFAAAASEEAAE